MTLLARLESILGAVPRHMLRRGRFSHKYYTRDGRLFERNRHTHRLEYLKPKRTCLARRLPDADAGMVSFLQLLLQVCLGGGGGGPRWGQCRPSSGLDDASHV